MMLSTIDLLKDFKVLIFSFATVLFCSANIHAQDFIGKDFLTCNFGDDPIYFQFIDDTVYISFDLEEDYLPFSIFSINSDTIFWNDLDNGDGCDPSITGLYIFIESGDSLIFDPIMDDCAERLQVLSVVLFKEVVLSNIESIDPVEFKFFPNPVISSFRIEANNQKNYHFQLVNTQGKTVLAGEIPRSNAYNIEWLARGTYFLSILDEDNVLIKTSKLIKL